MKLWKRNKKIDLRTEFQKKRAERIDKVMKEIVENPKDYININYSKLSKEMKIPISTLFDYWGMIKKRVEIEIKLKE